VIVVDSSVWIDYFNGTVTRESNLLDGLLGNEPLMIGDLILTEVLQGFRSGSDYESARDALDTLIFTPMVGRDIALASAGNYRALRSKGGTIRKTIDVLIGTFCLENNHPLLHSDRDFDIMEKHLNLMTV